MRRVTAVLIAVLACSFVAYADQLAKGDKEVNFTFSYQDYGFDSGGADIKVGNLTGAFGYLLTDSHEVGGVLSYSKLDDGTTDTDSTGLGVFYNYNFKTGTNLNPYVGAHYLTIGGDLGDVTDSRYGAAVGIKVFPWDNGGFNFGMSWDQLTGASGNPDGDGTIAFAGVQIKWN